MKTYIKKSIKGYYIEFPEEIDATYWEGKIGSTYEDFRDGKWVLLSDEQLAFHTEHPEASVSEVLSMILPEPYQRTLEDAKREKILQIKEYDRSSNVNTFNVTLGENTISHWLTPEQRANYKNSIDAAKLLNIEEVHPVFNGTQLTMSTSMAEMALAQIQIYADRCYIVTETHKSDVNSLENIEDVDNYDITTGYPEKLNFNLE